MMTEKTETIETVMTEEETETTAKNLAAKEVTGKEDQNPVRHVR